MAVFVYLVLKTFDYGTVVLGQDSDNEALAPQPVSTRLWKATHVSHKHTTNGSGVKGQGLDAAERGAISPHTQQEPEAEITFAADTRGDVARGPSVPGTASNRRLVATGPATEPEAQDRGGIEAPGQNSG